MAKKATETKPEEQKTTRRSRRTQKETTQQKKSGRSDDVLTSPEVQENGVIANIEMLFNSIKDLKRRGNYQALARVNTAQEENFARLNALNPELADEIIRKYRTDDQGNVISRKETIGERSHHDDTDNLLALIQENEETDEPITIEEELDILDRGRDTIETVKVEEFDNEIETDEVYDVITLPSNGECYPSKKNKIAVSYLTATDENFITSPNLYRDGLIIDCLLRRKIVDKNFDINSLCSGDVDAITFFLRVSSYGAEFPARFTDPDSGESFETVVDLNQVKVKDFKLKGDENGWFDFKLPITQHDIKFRFLTKKDERKLEKLAQVDNTQTKVLQLRELNKYLDVMLEDTNGVLDDDDLIKVEDAMDVMEKWSDALEEKGGLPINRLITNRMEMAIMAINGNTDRKYIKKYVRSMVASDSLALRRYMLENTPGMDFNIKIERPESLGGGSIDTFLEWGDTVFLSVT